MATQLSEAETGGGGGGFVSALPAMLWQRRWFVIVPVVAATVGGLVTAFLMHPVYESSATVLIESQQVPDDLIGALSGGGSKVSDMIGQRIARARERVLSRQDLIRLIRTYGLYPREQRTMPLSKIVDKMRDDTTVQAIDNAMMGGAPSKKNLGLANTIAITVAFQYDNPVKAQLVAQQFVDHFLEADASTQASQATDTVNFLSEQANQIQSQIQQLEGKALQIRSQNGTILALGNLSGNTTQDYGQIETQIAGLQSQSTRLQTAQDQGVTPTDTAVGQAEAQLRIAEARFSDTHPDVIAAKAQLAAAKSAAAAKPSVDPIQSQLTANRSQIAALQNARNMMASNSAAARAAAARAPAIASQLDQLEKAAEVLRDQYRGIGVKLQAAQIQARMESEQKGERLTLSDPPVVPDHPLRPNRPLIIAGSIAGGFGFGLMLVLLIEIIMRPIRGTAALRAALGEAPLAVIPDFDLRPSWIAQMIERRVRRKSNASVRA
ncbi:MAG TPA: Wzz/FepE/Etk N-terminal domain-containing protein [Sphingomonas sp.]|uniref:GumC family protein n=1 Tax=Sphingomonas sp. TaxID=28214 RepID=UPI002BCCA421|nr:Wzz/FepE/Etk N-terminal domain-containing protein [Sphingomonas sp.]HMI20054.1 Wzz/FepE/Etk N-terminal domain-containing protein [Sphingomonas sp.]